MLSNEDGERNAGWREGITILYKTQHKQSKGDAMRKRDEKTKGDRDGNEKKWERKKTKESRDQGLDARQGDRRYRGLTEVEGKGKEAG